MRAATNVSAAVVDNSFAPGGLSFGPPTPRIAPGGILNVTNPATGAHAIVMVIGVMAQQFVSAVWLNPTLAATLGYRDSSVFFVGVSPTVSDVRAAQLLKSAFFPFGLVLLDFAQLIQTGVQQEEAFIGLLEVFATLGLAVGIAAMGIVALRAVSERRTEVGMLRATGFTRRMILGAFLLEYSYVALLGVAIGTLLGVVLVYNTVSAFAGFISFSIPGLALVEIVAAAYILTIAAVLGPSFKASRLPPAEAIRYSE